MEWYFLALAIALALLPFQLVAVVFGPVGLSWAVFQLVTGHWPSFEGFRGDGR
ncbi:hypothetical protein [Martelella mangrovi]|uniref:Uncharacterized protein n=1 Tax=Martelella mangrovi TaxID=1397477 RepID=A0ABV2IH19_9HYPH